MKILFLVKYYPPFDRGGSEWSTHDLAYLLSKKGHQITILTPNYGALSKQGTQEGKIIRFPFTLKLKKNSQQPAPWWTNNIFWIFYSTYQCYVNVLRKKVDIIHVHSNEFIPAAAIVGFITGKPTVATFRDYQVLCNLGFCLWHKNKSCSLFQYFKNDTKFFLKNYSQSHNKIAKIFIYIALIRARFYQEILKYFALKINFKVAVSHKVKEIFAQNGFKKMEVINNPILITSPKKSARQNKIIYVGKLSKGKGIDLLFNSLPQIFKQTSISLIEVVGTGHLFEDLKKMARDVKISKKIKFIGHITHNEVIKKISEASLTIVPSIWPEPLPRAIIESILVKTPVVATDVGGNPEILNNGAYGAISEPDAKKLASAIIKTWKKRKKLDSNLTSDIQNLRKKYSVDVCNAYEKQYKLALK